MAAEKIYLNRDNTIDRQLTLAGTALTSAQMAAITRAALIVGDTTVDSTSLGGVGTGEEFDCATRASEGVIVMTLGGQTIPAGSYRAQLIIYDPDNTTGVVWDEFVVKVE
jgi:hypothetical protein